MSHPGYNTLAQSANAPQTSLTDRIMSMADQANNLSGQVFECGMRLGVLQPIPTTAPSVKQDESHIGSPLARLQECLNRIGDDMARIRSFIG